MRISNLVTFYMLLCTSLSCQNTANADSDLLSYIKNNPHVLKVVKKETGTGVEDDKGRTVIPYIYYGISILPTTNLFKESKFLVNRKCYEGFNVLSISNTPVFTEDQYAIIAGAPGYLIVTPPTKEKSIIVDYEGTEVEKNEKSMVQPAIVRDYSSKDGSFFVLGKNARNGYHLALVSKDITFIKPLSDHRIKVKEHGIILSNNSGDGGTLYNLKLEQIWSSTTAIPTHIFENSFVISNQSNYTTEIRNFNQEILFTSEFMRFSDSDIKDGVIKYLTHVSNQWGAVTVEGEEIIPLIDKTINWIEIGGKNYLKYFDQRIGKEITYDPIERKIISN